MSGAGGASGSSVGASSGTDMLSGALGGGLLANSLYNQYTQPNQPTFTQPAASTSLDSALAGRDNFRTWGAF